MDEIFAPAPQPASELGFHRILSPNAGLRVSPLCLGAMNFGDAWEGIMGKCDKEDTFKMLDFFYEQGGNFIDTANGYQNEQSETWIGEWMEARGVSDQMVIATKFTTGYRAYTLKTNKPEITSNTQGNHTKSVFLSVNASLKKLKRDYIDLLYLHWWDFSTSIPELMQSLNTLVTQGKVLYLGISDTPAWVVSKANEYARNHGLRTFSVYQGKWNAADRDMERDIIPMCRDEGMAICPWSALGGGNFKTEEQRKALQGEGRNMGGPSDVYVAVTNVLDKIAKSKNTQVTSVALAYVIHKTPNVYPIVGGRKIEHIKGNIEALKLKLSKEDIDEIEAATPFDPGFPMNFLMMGQSSVINGGTSDIVLVSANAHLRHNPHQQPARPE